MNILTTTMAGGNISRAQENVAWVYQSSLKTGLRWCYLFLSDSEAMICCMTGNPADKNFKILEDFRPATENELRGLDYMELMLNG